VRYFTENKATYQKATRTSVAPAQIHEHDDIRGAVQNAWHIVECVPENLAAKHAVFADLEQLSDRDCILATNSSSFRSSLISANLLSQAKCRVLNTHYFMPPHVRAVELMTNGHTAADIFTFLAKRMDEAGLNVYVAKKESTGFIHNRVWAAMKRELLRVVAEGVADPKTVDDIFFETVVVPGLRPFVAMDRKSCWSVGGFNGGKGTVVGLTWFA
jgi:3-hydroxyacyl-CoA dehydrogenase